ncbi:MAG: CHASE2 domain-containing protein [Leptolyngbyaceae cyanobacterium]
MTPTQKIIVFRLDGNLEKDGFKIELEVGRKGQPLISSFSGYLPPMPKLAQTFKQWQDDYHRWGTPSRIRPKEVVFTGVSDHSNACKASAKRLRHCFAQWHQLPEFLKLDIRLRELVNQDDMATLVLKTESDIVSKLPWHLWEFVDRYPQVEVVIEAKQYHFYNNYSFKENQPVRILSILGDATGIDIETDRTLLNSLPNAEVNFLVEPQRSDINQQLWDQSWDILFFAGHSRTEGQQGRIYINSSDSLTLDELRYGLRQSIHNGLKLAIFNSCDGLGLAHELATLSLPHLIVMREPVPDQVAQTFLQQFLRALSQGHPLTQAVRQARERLQGIEKQFPCASWLPIMYQQSHADEFYWPSPSQETSHPSPDLTPPIPETLPQPVVNGVTTPSQAIPSQMIPQERSVQDKRNHLNRRKMGWILASSLLTTGVIIGLRWLSLLQQFELQAYDQFVRSQPDNWSLRDRVLIVGIDEADIQYQNNQGMERQGSLSEQALQVLLEKITPHQPALIGLDIIHDYPFSAEVTHELEDQTFVAICQASSQMSNLPGIRPPDDFSMEKVGFNNVPLDPDGVVRRQVLGKHSDSLCPVNESFSYRLAQLYLQKVETIEAEWVATSSSRPREIRLGKRVLSRLSSNSGAYQFPQGGPGGYQVMVNYYPIEPNVIHLREVLSGSMDTQLQSLVANRIILIGVIDRDRHATSYNPKLDPVPGVIIHAHMMKQVIDFALGDRTLLSWWPEWLENLWIGGWSLIGVGIGGGIRRVWRSPFSFILSFMVGVGILWGTCLILFVQGWWVPFIPSLISFGVSTLLANYLIVGSQFTGLQKNNDELS